jgi:diaminopimelate decarboxylase
MTQAVRLRVASLDTDQLPAYVYDLSHLRRHIATVRAVLPDQVELYYAAKANPEPPLLTAIAETVDGFEVSSGGELVHVRATVPGKPLAFSGPGKSEAELAVALDVGVKRFHVESLHELEVLAALAERPVAVLLRVNLPVPDRMLAGGSLSMGGRPSPFGLDVGQAEEALLRLSAQRYPRLTVRGVHAHLASGLDAAEHLAVAERVVRWSADLFDRHRVALRELNLGGGMQVSYADPEARFEWTAYGDGLHQIAEQHPGVTFRIEPGRAITAYSGWYATDVLDVKHSHGEDFAVVRGGTHHLRTPATKDHDQPCAVLAVSGWPHAWARPAARQKQVGVVGQLCTPKDVLARGVPVPEGLRAGDRMVFAMAGAYAWNISHHGFLMHPHPSFHFLGEGDARPVL